MVYCDVLERRYTRPGIAGSNPAASVMKAKVHITKKGKEQKPPKCDQCGKEFPAMVVLKGSVWKLACKGNTKARLCFHCMESNLGRNICWNDLWPCGCTNSLFLGALLEKREPLEFEDKDDFARKV